MAMIAMWLKVDGERVAADLRGTCDKLQDADGEVFLDFSAVRRLDSQALTAIGCLAAQADEKAVKVVLRGVNAEVYKVLKLVKLAPRFSFVA